MSDVEESDYWGIRHREACKRATEYYGTTAFKNANDPEIFEAPFYTFGIELLAYFFAAAAGIDPDMLDHVLSAIHGTFERPGVDESYVHLYRFYEMARRIVLIDEHNGIALHPDSIGTVGWKGFVSQMYYESNNFHRIFDAEMRRLRGEVFKQKDQYMVFGDGPAAVFRFYQVECFTNCQASEAVRDAIIDRVFLDIIRVSNGQTDAFKHKHFDYGLKKEYRPGVPDCSFRLWTRSAMASISKFAARTTDDAASRAWLETPEMHKLAYEPPSWERPCLEESDYEEADEEREQQMRDDAEQS